MKTQITTSIDTTERRWIKEQGFNINFVITKGVNFLRNIEYYNDMEKQTKIREDNIMKLQEMLAKSYSSKEPLEDQIRILKKLCIENNISYREYLEKL